VSFAVIVTGGKTIQPDKVRARFGITVPILTDTALARLCGVYSTPQAVLITAGHELYYRGNYNRSRYCSDEKSNYAQIALNSLVNRMPYPHLDNLALTAYGCELPQYKTIQ